MRNLDDAYLFIQVVECGSLSAAGRKLNIAKSTLARRLHRLEVALGTPLFHNSGRSFVLTNFGNECLDQCRRIAREADELLMLAEQARTVPTGSLHIVCPPMLGDLILNQLTTEFAAEAPDVTLHIDAGTSLLDPRLVAADLIVYATFEDLPSTDVVAKKIVETPYVLVASPRLFEGALPSTPEELTKFPCLGLGEKSTRWRWVLERDGKTLEVPFKPRLSTAQMTTLYRAVSQGLGIAALPLPFCRQDLAEKRLVEVLPGWRPASVYLFAVYPSSKTLTKAARIVLERIVRKLSLLNSVTFIPDNLRSYLTESRLRK